MSRLAWTRRVVIAISVVALVTAAAVMRDSQSVARSWPFDTRNDRSVPFDERYDRARAHPVERVFEAGSVRALVIEARRVEPNQAVGPIADHGWFLEIVVEAERVRGDERVTISPREMLAMSSPPPDPVTTADPALRTRIIRDLVPALGASMDVVVVAWAADAGEPKGPGMHTAEQCALPLNPLGTCEMTKREGRILGRFSIPLASLGVPGLRTGSSFLPPPPNG